MAERIRWGILSTARIGLTRFIPGAQQARNSTVVAIASRDAARAAEAAAQLGIPKAHGSYEALLADPEVDAIYNPLPNSLHAEWTLNAAAAGKAVLCEKPLARDAAEAAEVVAGCKERGVLLMEAFMYRFHPQHAHVRSLIEGGAIGELTGVRTGFTFHMHPIDPNNVRLRADVAGGSLMDVGCYAVNAARMLFGEEPIAAVATYDLRPEFRVDFALSGTLEFSGHRYATLDCGFRGTGQGWYLVVGSTGTIEVPTAFVPNAGADTLVILNEGSKRHEKRIPGVNQYTLEAEEFAACLLEKREPRYPATDGVANMRAIDALYRSARSDSLRQPEVI
jgi:predicted dehydrogenase